jgi:hypothetical protein
VQITYPQEGATWKNSKAKHGTCARGQRWKAKQQQAHGAGTVLMHEPTSYFILCLSLILSLSSSSRSYLFLLSFIYAASAWLSLLKFSLAYSLPQFFILSHCAAGPRPARNQSHRRRSPWGGTRSPPIWGVHGATAPESRRPPTVPARAAHHPLRSYAVRRSSEPHRDASLTKWKPPGQGQVLTWLVSAQRRHCVSTATTRWILLG